MGATIPFPQTNPRLVRERDFRVLAPMYDRRPRPVVRLSAPAASEHRWLVDLQALARCRALFAGRSSEPHRTSGVHARQPILMDVPPAYDQFCHAHFASVKRLHPELTWDDACPAYAVALSAHASLHVALDELREKQLEESWDQIRGESSLAWKQARPLIADGCSALDRLDPLAMRR